MAAKEADIEFLMFRNIMRAWAGMDEYQKTDIPELIYRFDYNGFVEFKLAAYLSRQFI